MSAKRGMLTNFAALIDPDFPMNQLAINADGSINVQITGGSGGSISVIPAALVSAGASQFGLAVGAAAVGLTVPADAIIAQIMINGVDMRWRDDGTDPTAAVGMAANVGANWQYVGPLSAIKFIAQAGAGTIDVVYWK